MAEAIFDRVRRVLSGRIEDVVDRMERAGGESVMREAIREVDRAADAVRLDQENAVARRLQAERQQARLTTHAAELGNKARFAIDQGRDDLAEAALTRQVECEAQVQSLDGLQDGAREVEARLADSLAALRERKHQMEIALADFVASRAEATLGGDGTATPPRQVERRVEQAEAAFDRAMTGTGNAPHAAMDKAAVAGVAEIDRMMKGRSVADRLAALKAEAKAA